MSLRWRLSGRRWLHCSLLFAVGCVGAFPQANSDLMGIITDQSGAVVVGAKVVLTDPATGFSKGTESSATGFYDIPALNPATYNLKVSAPGFNSFEQDGITINVSSTARVDVKLAVGAEAQTIVVEADSLQVQTDSNVVSTVINSDQISNIATENRNVVGLATLAPGVSSAMPDNNTPTFFGSNATFSVNGLRQSHNIWLIDGGEADDRGGAGGINIMPSQDAIAELTILASNYPPDYGISSGATLSLSLKSGTQEFHGGLWEFARNTAFDANNYFNRFTIAWVNCFVLALPPRSPVRTLSFSRTSSTASCTRFAFSWCPTWSSIIAADQTLRLGAMPPTEVPPKPTP